MKEDLLLNKIEQILDQYVRPQLSDHYGNVEAISFSDGILNIKLLGQCSNCPSAKFTVEDVIKEELKKYVPEVEKIVLIEALSDDLIAFAKSILNHENVN